MTEEALDAAAEPAVEPSAEPRPRSRRRRRGGRGRGRGGSAKSTSSEQRSDSQPHPGSETADAGAAGEPRDAGAEEQKPRSRSSSRRRRRSGRTRDDRPETAQQTEQAAPERDGAPPAEAEPRTEAAEGDGEKPSPARRRRRRRRRKPAEAANGGQDTKTAEKPRSEPKRTAAAAKPKARPAPAKAPAAGPTRTSRTARKGAAERRSRRTEAQAPRRTDKTMLMTEHHGRLQIAVVEGRDLVEHYVARTGAASMVGNIYLGRVQNVLPGMEAAFIDVGRGRNGVLYAGEVSYDEDVEGDGRRIESVLKPGQSVLVQVTKDPMRSKGARLTAQVSLPGRYLVYVPDGGASGISRRLPDAERERLRKVIKRIRPSEAGVIVRTAAEGASEEDLEADLDRLKKTWESIKRKSRRGRAPKALYEEPELIERVVRDVFSPAEFERIVTDSPDLHERVAGYLREVAPDLLERVELHRGKLALFEEFHVAEQIHKALERKVWLPSGGYLFIDRVEAMTVIDVNSGKHVGKHNLEQTVFETNLEAADEIARQLRLRDIGGIIVIDFIDMLYEQNRTAVIRRLQEALARDKTRSQVFDITPLGLLEMTRKKVSAGLLESFSEPCPTCEGRGILLTHDVS